MIITGITALATHTHADHNVRIPLSPDPLAYDRLIRRFQSAAEREAEGRKKGYSGVLEADLWRSEAKVAALAERRQDGGAEMKARRDGDGADVEGDAEREGEGDGDDEIPGSKEEGEERWRALVEGRFLRGEDEGFGGMGSLGLGLRSSREHGEVCDH